MRQRHKRQIEAILQQVYQGGTGPPLIGVSYERVSHKRSLDGTSLETQPLDIEAWAARHNVRIVGHYVDRARTGTTENRPAYRQMLADLDRLRVQVVLVWKLDRFARNMLLQLQKIEEFTERGVALVSIMEMIDYTTAMGKQTMAAQAMFAQTYSDQLGERMERALRHTAESGFWVGPVPLGYVRQGRHQPLAINDDAATVREIFRRYATEHYSAMSLAEELNHEGHHGRDWRTGRPIPLTREGVRWILNNRAYIGKVTSGGREYQGNHPPLVDDEVFARCHAISQRRTTDNTQRHTPVRGLLQGIASCATCGTALWQHTSRTKGHVYHYYRCGGTGRCVCDAPLQRADAIDAQMRDLLSTIHLPERLMDRVMARLAAPAPPVRIPPDLQDQRDRLQKLYVRGHLSDEEYEAQYAALGDVEVAAPVAPTTVDFERAAAFLHDLPSALANATRDELQRLTHRLFACVWLAHKTIAALTPHQVYATLLQLVKTADCVTGVADGRRLRTSHIATMPLWAAYNIPYPPISPRIYAR